MCQLWDITGGDSENTKDAAEQSQDSVTTETEVFTRESEQKLDNVEVRREARNSRREHFQQKASREMLDTDPSGKILFMNVIVVHAKTSLISSLFQILPII